MLFKLVIVAAFAKNHLRNHPSNAPVNHPATKQQFCMGPTQKMQRYNHHELYLCVSICAHVQSCSFHDSGLDYGRLQLEIINKYPSKWKLIATVTHTVLFTHK